MTRTPRKFCRGTTLRVFFGAPATLRRRADRLLGRMVTIARRRTPPADHPRTPALLELRRRTLDEIAAHERDRAARGEGHLVPPAWLEEAGHLLDEIDSDQALYFDAAD
jgi:hypothetical protein